MAQNPPPVKRVKYISGKIAQNVCTTYGSRFNFKEALEVLTGEKPYQRTFTVHREPFTQRSKFLEAATSFRWTSGTNKPVDLTEHEPEVFAGYMQCVYNGTVTLPELPDYMGDNSFKGLIMLYLLANKLNDLTTTNLVMDEIIVLSEKVREIPSSYSITLVYKSTAAGSPLRKLCRDYYVHEAMDWMLEDSDEGEFHFEFLKDVLLEFRRMSSHDTYNDERRKIGCVNREKCYYHQHNDEHPKCP